jgi:hypothetical protein
VILRSERAARRSLGLGARGLRLLSRPVSLNRGVSAVSSGRAPRWRLKSARACEQPGPGSLSISSLGLRTFSGSVNIYAPLTTPRLCERVRGGEGGTAERAGLRTQQLPPCGERRMRPMCCKSACTTDGAARRAIRAPIRVLHARARTRTRTSVVGSGLGGRGSLAERWLTARVAQGGDPAAHRLAVLERSALPPPRPARGERASACLAMEAQREAIQRNVTEMLLCLGERPERDGLRDTPKVRWVPRGGMREWWRRLVCGPSACSAPSFLTLPAAARG